MLTQMLRKGSKSLKPLLYVMQNLENMKQNRQKTTKEKKNRGCFRWLTNTAGIASLHGNEDVKGGHTEAVAAFLIFLNF